MLTVTILTAYNYFKHHFQTNVEEEYRNWNAMMINEHELIEHFSMQGSPALFLCVVWKMLIGLIIRN